MENTTYSLAFFEDIVAAFCRADSDDQPEIRFDDGEIELPSDDSAVLLRYYQVSFSYFRRSIHIDKMATLSSLHPHFEACAKTHQPDFIAENWLQTRDAVLVELKLSRKAIRSWYIDTRDFKNHRYVLHLAAEDDPEKFNPAERRYYRLAHRISTEAEAVQQRIKIAFFGFTNAKENRNYIRKKQLAIGNLYQRMLETLSVECIQQPCYQPERFDRDEERRLLTDYLDSLQSFLATQYREYIATDLPAPRTLLFESVRDRANDIEVIASTVSGNFDHGDIAVMMEPVLKLTQARTGGRITFDELDFSINYIKVLAAEIRNQRLSTDNFARLLTELNVNSRGFIQYAIRRIREQLSQSSTLEQKILRLYEIQKELKQNAVAQAHPYVAHSPSVRDHLLEWTQAEIDCLEKIRHYGGVNSHPATPGARIKLTAGVSVGKLALMFSLLNEVGFLGSETKTDIFRFIAENFRTEKTDTISFKSISSKSYEPEPGAVEGVRRILDQMKRKLDDK